MKFLETSYTNRTGILKFPDHYVAIAVMIESDGIVANSEGKKIVPAGTILGGGFLLDDSVTAKAPVVPSLSTALTGDNNDLVFTALDYEPAVSVEYVDPAGNDQSLAISVADNVITVSLATGEAGAITSTASEILAAVNADDEANNLVLVTLKTGNTGAGVVTAMAETALSTAVIPEGVLLYDVDVTYGDAQGAIVIHGFVDNDKVTGSTAIARARMNQIVFIK